MSGRLDNGRFLVDRAWIIHRDDKERCLQSGRGGLNRGGDITRGDHLFSLNECVSGSTNGKEGVNIH